MSADVVLATTSALICDSRLNKARFIKYIR
jgi:hypothetical protein